MRLFSFSQRKEQAFNIIDPNPKKFERGNSISVWSATWLSPSFITVFNDHHFPVREARKRGVNRPVVSTMARVQLNVSLNQAARATLSNNVIRTRPRARNASREAV